MRTVCAAQQNIWAYVRIGSKCDFPHWARMSAFIRSRQKPLHSLIFHLAIVATRDLRIHCRAACMITTSARALISFRPNKKRPALTPAGPRCVDHKEETEPSFPVHHVKFGAVQ